jgi:hypothetical protein
MEEFGVSACGIRLLFAVLEQREMNGRDPEYGGRLENMCKLDFTSP